MELTLYNVALLTANLFMGWLLFFVLFREYRVDALRQRLFKLRMDLFDYAAGGGISFDDPAYGILRSRINSLIRYAHRFTAIQFFALAFMMDDVHDEELPLHRWETVLADIHDPAVRTELLKFNERMFENLLRHLVTGSALFAVFFVVTTMWSIGASFCSAIFRFMRMPEGYSASLLAPQMAGLSTLEAQAAEITDDGLAVA
jgi:hypothetical protein